MTDEELKQKAYARMEELQKARETNSLILLELRRTGTRLQSLSQSLQHTIVSVSVTPDGGISSGGDKISGDEWRELPSKLDRYLKIQKEIQELEDCLVAAGYGNLIGKP